MGEKEKLKGITVNGVSLNQFLKKNEWKEVEKQKSSLNYFEEEQREIKEKRKYMRNVGRKAKPYYYKKRSPDKGRKLRMSEINKEYLKTNLEGQETLAGKVLCVLLTGGEWKAKDIYQEINKMAPNSHQGRMVRKQDVYAGISRLSNSDFARLLKKEKWGSEIVYSLHENCYEYSPSDLMKIINKRDKSMTSKDIIGVDLNETLEENQCLPIENSSIRESDVKMNSDCLCKSPEEKKADDSIVSSALNSLAENLIKIVKEVENRKVISSKLQIEIKVMFGWIKENEKE